MGIENIEIKIVERNLSEEEAFEKEKEYIRKYRDLQYPLVNLTDGGDGSGSWYQFLTDDEKRRHQEKSKSFLGKKHSEETKEKMRKAARKRRWDEEHRKLFSIQAQGRSGYWKGKHLSAETRAKIGKTRQERYGVPKKAPGVKKVPKPVLVIKNGGIEQRFPSRKSCIEYYTSQDVPICEASVKRWLKTNKPYHSQFSRHNIYEGLIFIYEEDYYKLKSQSTIENTQNVEMSRVQRRLAPLEVRRILLYNSLIRLRYSQDAAL